MEKQPLLSFVLPAYNEEKNLPLLIADFKDILLQKLPDYRYEIILVNDGSKDDTWKVIKSLAKEDPHILGLNLSRNFGHQCALEAGLNHAKGEAVIMMDADGQHPPELVPRLIEEWNKGAEIVNTIREDTDGETPLKKVTSRMFYSLINKFSDTHITPGAADFRLVDKKVLRILNGLPEQGKFYRGLVSWVGFRTTYIHYRARRRLNGSTSYTIKRMYKFATDGLTGFSSFPLRLAKYIGLFIFLSGLVGLLYMLIAILFTTATFPIWVFLIVLTYLLNGLMFIVLWFIGNYVGRIYFQQKGRPTFIVSETS